VRGTKFIVFNTFYSNHSPKVILIAEILSAFKCAAAFVVNDVALKELAILINQTVAVTASPDL